MIGLKVVMGDPARTGDAFAWVGASFNLDDYKIKFQLAKQFFKTPYREVANYAIKIHNQIKPNFMGIETNNQGNHVLRLFKEKYHMDWLKGVSTSANLKESTRAKGFTLDKPYQIGWFKQKLAEHDIVFPSVPTKDMQELIDQIPKISQFITPGGQTSYRAYRSQHDDLFMAALHCTNFIRLFIEQQKHLT